MPRSKAASDTRLRFNPRSEPSCKARWRHVALPFQTHIRSPIGIGRTNIPLACGEDPGGTRPFYLTALEAMSTAGSSTLDCREMISCPAIASHSLSWPTQVAAFIIAPSMATPAVTYFHHATSSFRARATIVALRRVSTLLRSRNHWLNAESG